MEGYLMGQLALAVDHWHLLCYTLSLNNFSSTNQRSDSYLLQRQY
jgi:hypothetical protein